MRTMSLQQVLEFVRAHPGTLPQAIATHLLCASVWRASLAHAPLRAGLVVLDSRGSLLLDPAGQPATSAASDASYVAPEVLAGAAQDDPRVLVYAAGALGYHLLTTEPAPRGAASQRVELSDPIGEIVRTALAVNPRDRFGTLEEMSRALHAVHPAPAPDVERHLFAGVFALCARWDGDDGAIAQLRDAAARIEEGGPPPSAAQLVRWVRGTDAAIEDMQRRQLDLMLTLAAREALATNPPARAEDERAARVGEQIELLQRIATLAPAAPPPVRENRGRGMRWLRWCAPVAASAVVSLGIVLVATPRVARVPAAPGIQAEGPANAAPVPVRVAANAGAAPASAGSGSTMAAAPGSAALSSRMVASPIVLAGTEPQREPRRVDANAERPPAAAPRRALPPRPMGSSPKTIVSKAATESARQFLDAGERALRDGNAVDALNAFELALAAEPDLAPAMRGAAIAYAMQRKNEQAKEHLRRYLQMAPDGIDAPDVKELADALGVTPN